LHLAFIGTWLGGDGQRTVRRGLVLVMQCIRRAGQGWVKAMVRRKVEQKKIRKEDKVTKINESDKIK
jgi:hypothetical protein